MPRPSSIRDQAVKGFDFPAVISRAYADGVRIFLEMGPHASCTGMIGTILKDRPHLAASVCVRGEDDGLTLLKFLGTLAAHRIPVDLDRLYGKRVLALRLLLKTRTAGTPAADNGHGRRTAVSSRTVPAVKIKRPENR